MVNPPEIFVCVAALAPPVSPPETVGVAQLYVVPAGTIPFVTFAGVEVKVPPLQIELVMGVIAGTGFTVAITVNVAPEHVPEVGVIV